MHLIDWYPTLSKLAGAEQSQALPVDGLDLWPLITQGQPLDREVLLVGSHPDKIAVRRGDWKLIRFTDRGPNSKPRYELYNLAEDISETNDLSDKRPKMVKELAAEIQRLTADAVADPQRGRRRAAAAG